MKSSYYKFLRALLFSLLIAAIPLFVHVFYVSSLEFETVKALIEKDTLSESRIVADKANKTVEQSQELLAVLSKNPIVYGGGARCDEFLSDLLENNPKYTS